MASDPVRDTVARILRSALTSGAALALTAAAATPALAAGHGGDDHGRTTADERSVQGQQSSSAREGDRTAADQSDADQSDSDQAGSGQSGADRQVGNEQQQEPSRAGGGATEHGAQPASGHNPPGNNGTVKIHDDSPDASHHNVPHVDCGFFVDFWGFDLGQGLSVSFTGQAPTGKGVAIPVTAPTTIASTTDAGGGNDYDGELAFPAGSLDLSGLGSPQPQQGFHVTLTVTTGEPGGVKHKVFWIAPCTSGQVSGSQLQSPAESGPTTRNATVAAGSTSGGSIAPAAQAPAEVLGERVVRAQPSAALPESATRAGLPFTGADLGAMAAAGAAAIGAGAGMTLAARRRRRTSRAS